MTATVYEWFANLASVPGVSWQTPETVVVDPRLANAQPIPDQSGYAQLGQAWVDSNGVPLADEHAYDRSPAEGALSSCYETSDPSSAVWQMCHVLALPGTRYDYHAALHWLDTVGGVPMAWVEAALWADVQLVLGDPARTMTSPRWGEEGSRSLERANEPIVRLMNVYLREGFLEVVRVLVEV